MMVAAATLVLVIAGIVATFICYVEIEIEIKALRQELAVRDAELKLIHQMRIEEESTLKGWKHE